MKTTDNEFERLRDYMYDRFGINLSQKRVLIEGRLSSMLTQRGYTDFSSYIDDLMKDRTGQEASLLVSKLTTNFTYFLREAGHYDFMRDTVIKPMLEKNTRQQLRIWSAASSSGEEPYSIAMTAADCLGLNKNIQVNIKASDISDHVLKLAREGVYAPDRVAQIPPSWLTRYFTKTKDGNYAVKPDIKRMITYQYFNLNDTIGWGQRIYDVVFCRNVMIYFDKPTRQALIKRLYDTLTPGGYLFIGMSESLINLTTDFTYIKPSVYQRPAEKTSKKETHF
ncbi:MAG: protein-glutamate O-methyltransferase CheR [Clostridia bacterium]|nr:protein-glutamate O-methyltransferase CheR [Clostridia bacterium]